MKSHEWEGKTDQMEFEGIDRKQRSRWDLQALIATFMLLRQLEKPLKDFKQGSDITSYAF